MERRRGQAAGPAADQDGQAEREQQDHLERVQRDGDPDAELQAHDHRRDHERAVEDRDDLGDPPDVRVAEHVLHDVLADEDVDAAERDDVPEDRDDADGHRDLGADRLGDVGDERPGAGVDAGELGQAARRGAHPHHGDQEDQRRGRARHGDHDAGGEEQVERRGDLSQSRHDHTEQPELAALQGLGGVGHR